MVVNRLQVVMGHGDAVTALTADQMVVLALGEFIHNPPAADMRDQRQTVGNQKIEGAVDRCLCQPGHFFPGPIKYLGGGKMSVQLLDHLKNG